MLIHVLIDIVALAVFAWVVVWAANTLAVPEPVKWVGYLIIVVVAALALLPLIGVHLA